MRFIEEPKESKIEEEHIKNGNKIEVDELKENKYIKRIEIVGKHNCYAKEGKLKILKEYDKIKNQREKARRYNIPLRALAGWTKIRNTLENENILLKSNVD